MPIAGGISVHNDAMHNGNAARDAVSGVCGLDALGDALVSQSEPRTVDGIITAGIGADLTAHDASTAAHGVAEVADVATVSAEIDDDVAALVATKNAANGIAGLDAAGRLLDIQMPGIFETYTISDDILQAHDAEVLVNQTVYTKYKTITLTTLSPNPSIIRIKFDMKADVGVGTTSGRIYKNGAPIGTERSTTSGSYTTYSEDISFSEGDTLELWAIIGMPNTGHLRNFRVCGVAGVIPLAVAIVTGNVGVAVAFSATNS